MACNVLTSFYRPYTAENSADSYKWLEGCGGITASSYSFVDGMYYVNYNMISSLIKNQDDTFTPSLLGNDSNFTSKPTDFGDFNTIKSGGGLYIYTFLNPDIMRVDRFEVDLVVNGTTHTYTELDNEITVIRPSVLDSNPQITDEIKTGLTTKYNTKYYGSLDKYWITNKYYFVPDPNEIQFINNHVIGNIPTFDTDGYGYNKYSRYKITFADDLGFNSSQVGAVYVRVYLKYNDDLGDVNIENGGGTNEWIKLHTTFTGYDITNKKNLYNNMTLTCNNENVCMKPNLKNRFISYYLRKQNLSAVALKNGTYKPYIYLNIPSSPPSNKYSFVGLYYNITSVEPSSNTDVNFELLKEIDVTPDEYGTYKFRFDSYNDINQVGKLYLNIYAIYYGTKDIKSITQRRKRIIKAY
jgi:hypothetical protein